MASNHTIVLPNAIIRKKGFIYFVDKDGNVCSAPQRKGSKKGRMRRKIKAVLTLSPGQLNNINHILKH